MNLKHEESKHELGLVIAFVASGVCLEPVEPVDPVGGVVVPPCPGHQ